jgi:hypothetical protein
MYSVLRRYRVRLGTAGEAAVHVERSLLPLLRRVPGFVAHYTMDAGNGTIASLTLFETTAGAEASSALLKDWFRSDWPAFQQIPPETSVGAVLLHGVASRAGERLAVGERADELLIEVGNCDWSFENRRAGADRRALSQRRVVSGRRQAQVSVPIERRAGGERRVSAERRVGTERRLGMDRRNGARGGSPAWVALDAGRGVGRGMEAERPAWALRRPIAPARTG